MREIKFRAWNEEKKNTLDIMKIQILFILI